MFPIVWRRHKPHGQAPEQMSKEEKPKPGCEEKQGRDRRSDSCRWRLGVAAALMSREHHENDGSQQGSGWESIENDGVETRRVGCQDLGVGRD